MDEFNQGPMGAAPMGGAPSGAIAQKVKTPATALMVVGGLYVLLGLCGLGSNIFMMVAGQAEQLVADPQMQQILAQQSGVSGILGAFLGLALGAAQIFGGMQMKNMQNHTLAIVGAVAACLPCSICCIFGLPVGIWAIVTLLDDQVKAAFTS
jgi:hypothetical protein